jgi:hypothetical protein
MEGQESGERIGGFPSGVIGLRTIPFLGIPWRDALCSEVMEGDFSLGPVDRNPLCDHECLNPTLHRGVLQRLAGLYASAEHA